MLLSNIVMVSRISLQGNQDSQQASMLGSPNMFYDACGASRSEELQLYTG